MILYLHFNVIRSKWGQCDDFLYQQFMKKHNIQMIHVGKTTQHIFHTHWSYGFTNADCYIRKIFPPPILRAKHVGGTHLMDSRPPVTSSSMIFKHGTQATISSAFREDCSLAFCKVDDDKIMLGMQQWDPQSASVHKGPSTAARRRNEGSSLLVCHGPPPAVVSPLPSCSSPQITCNFTRRHLSFQWLPTVTFELIWRCSCYQKGGS